MKRGHRYPRDSRKGNGKERVILEEEEDGQVEEEGGGQDQAFPALGFALHKDAGKPGDRDGEQYEQKIGGVPAGIEEEGGGQEQNLRNPITGKTIPRRYGAIKDKYYRKEEQILPRIKVHNFKNIWNLKNNQGVMKTAMFSVPLTCSPCRCTLLL
jgi:hypothetical protein